MPRKISIAHEDIAGSEFEDLNMTGTHFTNINLSGAQFHDINFSDVRFTAAQIGGTMFKHIGPPPCQKGNQTRQRPVTFEEGILCDSVFRKMDMTNVKIEECDVTGMTIDGFVVTDLIQEWKRRNG